MNRKPARTKLPSLWIRKNQSEKIFKSANLEDSLSTVRLIGANSNSAVLEQNKRENISKRPEKSPQRLEKKKTLPDFPELNKKKLKMTKFSTPKYEMKSETSFLQPGRLGSEIKVDKIIIEQLDCEELKHLKGPGRIKRTEMDESLMQQRQEEFQEASSILLSDIRKKDKTDGEEENSFIRSTTGESLIFLVTEKFLNYGINANTLERFVADIIFLVEQGYNALCFSFNFEVLVAVICESLLFGVLKLDDHKKRALAILFQSIEESIDDKGLDIELLISNVFQIWQKFHRKKNPMQSEVLSCLCNLARRIHYRFFFFPDPIRMIFLSHTLKTISLVISSHQKERLPQIKNQNGRSRSTKNAPHDKKKAIAEEGLVKNKLHWLLETALKSSLTRLAINNNFVAKGELQNLIFCMRNMLENDGEQLLRLPDNEKVLDFLAVWGLLLKNSDTLDYIMRWSEPETLKKSFKVFFRFLNERFPSIIEEEKVENLAECLEIYSQIFQNRRLYEEEMLYWDVSLVFLPFKVLTDPLESHSNHRQKVSFKRKTYCVGSEKLTKMVFLYVSNGATFFELPLPVLLANLKTMVNENICFLQEEKCFCYQEARAATQNLLDLLDLPKNWVEH